MSGSGRMRAALVAGIHILLCHCYQRRGWPGHKHVHARIRRAMPGHDEESVSAIPTVVSVCAMGAS